MDQAEVQPYGLKSAKSVVNTLLTRTLVIILHSYYFIKPDTYIILTPFKSLTGRV